MTEMTELQRWLKEIKDDKGVLSVTDQFMEVTKVVMKDGSVLTFSNANESLHNLNV